MRVRIEPGSTLGGTIAVPGDKSIAHRWLILAATALGPSLLVDLPGSLDVRSTAGCLAAIAPSARPALEGWAKNDGLSGEGDGSTWNGELESRIGSTLEVQGEGRRGLRQPRASLACGNSGTTMRLLAGLLASIPLETRLIGDASLSSRPMERVAEPLRMMGAEIVTNRGHAPIDVRGGSLRGIDYATPVPTAQVKSAILLAALAAEGRTTVREPSTTRDHTERALLSLGAPLERDGSAVTVGPFQHEGFEGRCPGDASSAAFLVAAAALTGSAITIDGVGLNPTRTRFLGVMTRMGVIVEAVETGQQMGEPVGTLQVRGQPRPRPIRVEAAEVPAVIDEIPILALLAAHAPGDSWFLGAGELRVKESDRLDGIVTGIRGLGGHAALEGDDLVVGGGGLGGGDAFSAGDHRLAMAFVVGALAAEAPCTVEGAEAAAVSFPGFAQALASLGAHITEDPGR
jgi:3-phosphoshikimate 1-carboxyvinyltransferase